MVTPTTALALHPTADLRMSTLPCIQMLRISIVTQLKGVGCSGVGWQDQQVSLLTYQKAKGEANEENNTLNGALHEFFF